MYAKCKRSSIFYFKIAARNNSINLRTLLCFLNKKEKNLELEFNKQSMKEVREITSKSSALLIISLNSSNPINTFSNEVSFVKKINCFVCLQGHFILKGFNTIFLILKWGVRGTRIDASTHIFWRYDKPDRDYYRNIQFGYNQVDICLIKRLISSKSLSPGAR